MEPPRIFDIERPHSNLLTLYLIRAFLTGPLLIIVLPLLYFRYRSMRYRFDDEGVSMRVGILFQREVNLTYARIQDIHMRSGILQRWLKLADLQIQTASGSAAAEMTLEGLLEYAEVRDFLYSRMRGHEGVSQPSSAATASAAQPGGDPETVALLQEVVTELAATRKALETIAPKPGALGPMLERLKELVLRLLKVPPEPEAPAGDHQSMQVFRASNGFYRYRWFGWLFRQTMGLLGVIWASGSLFLATRWVEDESLQIFQLGLEGFVALAFIGQVAFSYAMLRLDYEMRWYMVTDRSLRIREGVTTVHEMTMTFANIQNISIVQGPLQRFFGIADLKVQTAGGGGAHAQNKKSAQPMHIGFFRGVDNAEQVRDMMLERLRMAKNAGLGDHEDLGVPDAPAPQIPSASFVDVLRTMRDEAAGLRAAAERAAS